MKRLDAIIEMVPKTYLVADIGCDHGKIAVTLIKMGKAERVICSDISEKSLDKARRLVVSEKLDDKILLRQGNGLSILEDGEAGVAIIAGMGGDLIAKILEAGKTKDPEILVLSCNTAPEVLRQWLCGNGYEIDDEDLIFENRHFLSGYTCKKGNEYGAVRYRT